MDFFGDFGLRDTLQERIALKPIEIDMDRTSSPEIFSIVIRFRQSKSRFSRFKETCAQGHQSVVPP